MKSGSCLCGAVRYEFDEPARPVIVCHCMQCRKQTGSFLHSSSVNETAFRITQDRGLKWYRSSDTARRGFCSECGSVLFWKGDTSQLISFTAGSIDGPTGLQIDGHIYCDFKGDYYTIEGGRYQMGTWED